MALDWLNKAGDEPFFLWLHYFDPHETYLLPPMIPGVFTYTIEQPLTDIHLQLYDVEIKFVDLMIADVLRALSRLGLMENTLIVLTSDHGQGLGDHDYWYHTHRLYQEQIHVPLIFTGKSIPNGARIDNLVRSVDIVPTVLDLLEYPVENIPPGIDGVSLRSMFEGQANTGRKKLTAYSETSEPKVRDGESPLFSIIENEFKLIYQSESPNKIEMYNLADDALEKNDVYSIESEQAKELLTTIERLQEATSIDLSHIGKKQEKEWEDKLKSLGYIN